MKSSNLQLKLPKYKVESYIEDIQSTLLNCIDGFYFILDIHKRFILVSETIQHKLGYGTEELIGKPVTDIVADVNKEFVENIIHGMIEKETVTLVPEELELELVDHKFSTHDYAITFNKKFIKQTDELILLGFCRDIGKQKKREKDYKIAKEKAEISDKKKSEFLANMSHEIRTPLNGIIGFSTMIERNSVDHEKRTRYLRIIHSSTSQLLALVNDIIDISKIEAGQLKMMYSRVEINSVLDDLSETFQSEADRLEKDKVRFEILSGSPDKAFHIVTDEVRLRQVYSNLLSNALKFTEAGTITFGYTIEKKFIRCYVKDSGLGIPERNIGKIFSRFKQTREGRKSKYEGTGLGLAISKGIIDILGGEIGVRSEKGKGSEFYFTIPLE